MTVDLGTPQRGAYADTTNGGESMPVVVQDCAACSIVVVRLDRTIQYSRDVRK